MAIIYSYPKATPTTADYIIGSKIDELGNPTKSFLISDLATLIAAEGPPGPQGPQGTDGAAATIMAGSTTTGLLGTSASVVNSGTTNAAVFDFTIPRGETGEQGLNWVGSWAALGDFVVDDAVQYNGSSWICILDTGSSAVPPSSDPTHWQLLAEKGLNGSQGLYWVGEWSAITGYNNNQAVQYNGSSYICISPTPEVMIGGVPNPSPDIDPTSWDLLAEKGAIGLPGLFAQTGNGGPVTATTVETTILGPGVGSLTVPANMFQIGDSFQASLDGIISCVGTATIHVRVKTLTGVLLADTGVIALDSATSKSWLLTLYFTIRTLGGAGTASISSGGLFSYIKNSGTNFEGYVLSNVNNTTFNTTIDNTLNVTVEWNTANVGNSILSRNFTLTKVY